MLTCACSKVIVPPFLLIGFKYIFPWKTVVAATIFNNIPMLLTLADEWVLLHFSTPTIYDSSWKNAAESFTVALTLTLEGYKSAINSADGWMPISFEKTLPVTIGKAWPIKDFTAPHKSWAWGCRTEKPAT